MPVEVGTGGRTKFNRATQGLEKQHWIDAATVGASTPTVFCHNTTGRLTTQIRHAANKYPPREFSPQERGSLFQDICLQCEWIALYEGFLFLAGNVRQRPVVLCRNFVTPNRLLIDGIKPLQITAKGHGTRQMCGTNKFGFPTRHRSRTQIHRGFQTGDIARAIVTSGKKIGSYVGRVLCRATGSFDIGT